MSKQLPAYLKRTNDLIEAQVLAASHVLIVGLGRTGIAVLKQLLQLPIGAITAIDHDVISERDMGSVFPVGVSHERFKVRAATLLAQFVNPSVQFNPALMRLSSETLGRFSELVSSANFVVWAADDWDALSDAVPLFHHQVPAVGIALSEAGAISEIAWSLPGQTPCLACTLNAKEKRSQAGAASLQLDVDAVANVAVRVMLGLALAGHRGFSLFEELLDPSHCLLVVHNRSNQFTASSNPLVPVMTRLVRVDVPGCSVCRRR